MTHIHQVVVDSPTSGPARMLAEQLQRVFAELGPSMIASFAENSDLDRSHPDDVLVVHADAVTPELVETLLVRSERLLVVDHGVASWQPYLAFAPEHAGRLAASDMHLKKLAPFVQLAVVFDEARKKTLLDMGFRKVHQCDRPVFVADSKDGADGAISGLEPHGPTVNHFQNSVEGPTLLFDGQILPHERVELLVQAFHVLSTHLVPEANLAIVGSPCLSRYSLAIERQINELNLNKAWLAGTLTPSELVAYYQAASMFVSYADETKATTAVSFNLPVISVADGPGLTLNEKDPFLFAEAVAEVLASQEARTQLLDRARLTTRIVDFDVAFGGVLRALLRAVA